MIKELNEIIEEMERVESKVVRLRDLKNLMELMDDETVEKEFFVRLKDKEKDFDMRVKFNLTKMLAHSKLNEVVKDQVIGNILTIFKEDAEDDR